MKDNLRLLSLPKANVSVARNAGALNARGSILLFLDADTTLAEDALKKIKDKFNENYSVATTLVKPDEEKFKFKFAMGFKNFYHRTRIYQGASGSLICRKDDFQTVGGYPLFQVKEHRKLTIALKKEGQYNVINTSAITSMRRFEQWGLVKAGWFWVKQFTKNYVADLKKEKYEIVR